MKPYSSLISKQFVLACFFFLLIAPESLCAQAKNRTDLQKSARDFVRQFYDWYVPIALEDHPGPASDLALKDRGAVFTSELSRALKRDSDASAKANGYIVGLDFDPFLNSQDPDDRYEVGKVTRQDDSYSVEVFGVSSGKREETPTVRPELIRRNGRWVFANFYYPGSHGGDLLSVLRRLAKERQRPAK